MSKQCRWFKPFLSEYALLLYAVVLVVCNWLWIDKSPFVAFVESDSLRYREITELFAYHLYGNWFHDPCYVARSNIDCFGLALVSILVNLLCFVTNSELALLFETNVLVFALLLISTYQISAILYDRRTAVISCIILLSLPIINSALRIYVADFFVGALLACQYMLLLLIRRQPDRWAYFLCFGVVTIVGMCSGFRFLMWAFIPMVMTLWCVFRDSLPRNSEFSWLAWSRGLVPLKKYVLVLSLSVAVGAVFYVLSWNFGAMGLNYSSNLNDANCFGLPREFLIFKVICSALDFLFQEFLLQPLALILTISIFIILCKSRRYRNSLEPLAIIAAGFGMLVFYFGVVTPRYMFSCLWAMAVVMASVIANSHIITQRVIASFLIVNQLLFCGGWIISDRLPAAKCHYLDDWPFTCSMCSPAKMRKTYDLHWLLELPMLNSSWSDYPVFTGYPYDCHGILSAMIILKATYLASPAKTINCYLGNSMSPWYRFDGDINVMFSRYYASRENYIDRLRYVNICEKSIRYSYTLEDDFPPAQYILFVQNSINITEHSQPSLSLNIKKQCAESIKTMYPDKTYKLKMFVDRNLREREWDENCILLYEMAEP